MLKKKTFEGSRASRMFAEDFFAALRDWDITIFGVIVRGPFNPQTASGVHVADIPAFVDSVTSAGIPIADVCAYILRVYQENRLSATPPSQDDEYRRAARSWYRYTESQARHLVAKASVTRFGLYHLPAGVR